MFIAWRMMTRLVARILEILTSEMGILSAIACCCVHVADQEGILYRLVDRRKDRQTDRKKVENMHLTAS